MLIELILSLERKTALYPENVLILTVLHVHHREDPTLSHILPTCTQKAAELHVSSSS